MQCGNCSRSSNEFPLAEEAYRNGEQWRIELIKYLRTNRDLAFSEISSLPGITPYFSGNLFNVG